MNLSSASLPQARRGHFANEACNCGKCFAQFRNIHAGIVALQLVLLRGHEGGHQLTYRDT